MRLAIKGSEQAVAEMRASYGNCDWVVVHDSRELATDHTIDAYFQLDADACKDDYTNIPMPVFIHAVSDTLQELSLPDNIVRINGWPGFLNRKTWEVAGNMSNLHSEILESMGIQICRVADAPGFIAASVLCMIINEAFFALEEGVSTQEEIDVAMKLGTGYPMGPFEWAEKIGTAEVVKLLSKLHQANPIYTPASSLINLVDQQ